MKTPSGAIVTPQSNKVLAYRNDIRVAWGEPTPVVGASSLIVGFYFQRPKSHYTAKGTLKAGAPRFMKQKPDLDKLVRSVMDALSGYAFADDQQVALLQAHKDWTDDAPFTMVHFNNMEES
jgi:Holliday junction resolvase RusA-like endonuclease